MHGGRPGVSSVGPELCRHLPGAFAAWPAAVIACCSIREDLLCMHNLHFGGAVVIRRAAISVYKHASSQTRCRSTGENDPHLVSMGARGAGLHATVGSQMLAGPVSCAQQRPPLPAVPLRAFRAAINAFRCPAGRPLRWAVEGDRKCTYFLSVAH